MQAEQARRGILSGVGGTATPVLLALSYTFLLPALHAQQGSESGILTQTSAGQPSRQDNQIAPATKPSQARLVNTYAHLPLSFEANGGQAPGQVQFLARGQGFTLFLAGNEAVLALQKSEARSQKSEGGCRLSVVRCQSAFSRLGTRDSGLGAPNPEPQTPSPETRAPSHEPRGPNTPGPVLRMKLLDADPAAAATGVNLLPGRANYFIGNDPAQWRTRVPTYSQVVYRSIYPGVDLVYYGHAGRLEYDFRVNPGASPDAIRMALGGARQVRLTANGNMALAVPGGEVWLQKPVAYQVDAAGEKRLVDARFMLQATQPQIKNQEPQITNTNSKLGNRQSTIDDRQSEIGFRVGSYDPSRVLVIDPTLSYSTYLGGAGADTAFGVAVDSSGDAYIAGQTTSTDFPVSSAAFQSKFGQNAPGGEKTGACANAAPATDAFVTELNPDGSAVVYSTYLGGEGCDAASAIALDSSGNAYVTGSTDSSHFPVTSGSVQTVPGGGTDIFVTEVAAGGGSLPFSTFFGGKGNDYGAGIQVAPGKSSPSSFPAVVLSVYVVGSTASYTVNNAATDDFPVTNHALQSNFGGGATDAFFLDLTLTQQAQSAPNVWTIAYSTYLGGSGADSASAVALDASGNIYATGATGSPDFPVVTGASGTPFQDTLKGTTNAFLSEFSLPFVVPNCVGASPCEESNLLISTYLGGSATDAGNGIAVDPSDNIYVVGNTTSTDFPLRNPTGSACAAMSTALQGSNAGGQDAFAVKFAAGTAGGCLSYSTYLGGSGTDSATAVAADSNGNALVTGNTQSTGLFGSSASGGNGMVTSPLQSACATGVTSSGGAAGCDDAFVASLDPTGSALNYGSYLGGALHDQGNAIAVDTSGDAYIAGVTESADFPTTPGGVQPCLGDPPTATTPAPTTCTQSTATSNAFVAKIGVAAALVQVAPAVLPFGTEALTGTSAPQTVTVTNNSGSSLTFSPTDITATTGFAVEGSGCTSAPVANAGSCTVSVTFNPTTAGTQTGRLTFTDSAAGSPQTVILAGTGVNVTATVSPGSLSFPSQSLNTTSEAQAVTLSNVGSSPLAITSISTSAGSAFGETNNCGSTLAASSTCTINVTFSPTTTGIANGTLTITDDAPNSPQTVSLTGTGGNEQLSLSAANLNFGSVVINTKTTSQSVVITNTGDTTVSITSVTISGASAFSLPSKSPCQGSLGVAGTCTVSINFKPTTSGSLSAMLLIASNAPGSPQTVALAGQGADFGVTSSPTTSTVNPGQSATFTVTVTPIGGYDSEVTLSCQGAPTYGSCSVSPGTVAPNGSAPINATVTVTTLAPARLAPPFGRFLPPFGPFGLALFHSTGFVWLLAGLLGITVAVAGKRRRPWVLVVGALVLALFWMGCSSSPPNNAANNGTPPGPYQVTITGASNGLSHSVTVTVNVNT